MRKLLAIWMVALVLLGMTACGGEPSADSSLVSNMTETPVLPDGSTSSSIAALATSTAAETTLADTTASTANTQSSSTKSPISASKNSTTAASTTASDHTSRPSEAKSSKSSDAGTATTTSFATIKKTTTSRITTTAVRTTAKKPQAKAWYSHQNATVTKATVDAVMTQAYQKPRNVIVMIGDGMGPNDLVLTEKYHDDCWDFGLIMNRFINHGMATTASADNAVTDSAASATALATGHKTNNNMVGMLPDKTPLKNISEIARENGKKVGIVTNDLATGATPSGFTVHAVNRVATRVLVNGYVDFMPDVLIGQGQDKFDTLLSDENKVKLKRQVLVSSTISGASTVLDTDKGSINPFFGFFISNLFGPASYDLAYATDMALNRLDNKDGFFLMVESAGTDKAGHENRIDAKMNNVITFERAIAVVLNFMKKNPDTLLIITSDHETGGVQLPAAGEQPTNALFTSKDHTATNVRVFALGAGTEYFKGKTVDNTDIAKFVIAAVQGK